MRATLDIDDDVLNAARELATAQNTPLGPVISQLARKALAREGATHWRNGVPLLRRRDPSAPRPSLQSVRVLRDDE